MSSAPWTIYAERLQKLRYGYPLWVPDPPPGQGEVQLGDVGWIYEGEFMRMFNTMRPTDEDQALGVPPAFTRLDPAPLHIRGPRERIRQGLLSDGISHERVISGGIDASGPSTALPSGRLQLSFSCLDNSGAFLAPSPSVNTHDIMSRISIVEYIKAHHDSWFDFANARLGLGLRQEDIHFVCGTKKTVRWTVAAFQGRYREKNGSLTATLGALPGSVNLSMSISDQSLPSTHYREGPPGRTLSDLARMITVGDAGAVAPTGSTEAADQCVFIHTYRMKKRNAPWGVLKAGAGPHELRRFPRDPDGVPDMGPRRGFPAIFSRRVPPVDASGRLTSTGGNPGAGSRGPVRETEVEPDEEEWDALEPVPAMLDGDLEAVGQLSLEEQRGNGREQNLDDAKSHSDGVEGRQRVDPVGCLLDYILRHSDAEMAIASDVDLYIILRNESQWPEDMDEALSRIAPTVHVYANGVGTVLDSEKEWQAWLGGTGEEKDVRKPRDKESATLHRRGFAGSLFGEFRARERALLRQNNLGVINRTILQTLKGGQVTDETSPPDLCCGITRVPTPSQ